MIYGGSGIEKSMFDFFVKEIPAGSIVLELGSGMCSTKLLGDQYKLYSVENDPRWIDLYDPVTYIYAPLKNGWYDIVLLSAGMPDYYDAVLVDGPCGDRSGILANLDLFDRSSAYFIHDTWREIDTGIANAISDWCGRPVKFIVSDDTFAYIKKGT
jgi:hypothetical protein